MSPQALSLYLLALALFSLGIWVLRKYQQSLGIRYLAGFLFGLALIAGVDGAVSSLIGSEASNEVITFVAKLGFTAGVVTFSMLLMFSLYYPIPSRTIPQHTILLWVVPITFFVPLALLGDDLLRGTAIVEGGLQEENGPAFFLFPLFVFIYLGWTILNFVKKLQYVQGIQTRHIRLFLWALIFSATFGFIFDVLLPALGEPRYPVGIYAGGLLFGLSAYIVTRK